MKWNGQKSPKICKWSDYKQMRWNEVQWKGQQPGKMIHIEILKSAKKGKQRDRRRSWRNKMLQKKERKFWNKVKTRKVNGMDDIKCTEMDQTSPSWSSLKSQDFIAFSERKNLKSENEMEHTLWKGYMIKSNAIERKKNLNGVTIPKCTEMKWGAVKRGQLGMKAASQESTHQHSWGSGNITQETRRKFKSHLMMYCFPSCLQNGALPQAEQWYIDVVAPPATPPAPLFRPDMTLSTKYTFS